MNNSIICDKTQSTTDKLYEQDDTDIDWLFDEEQNSTVKTVTSKKGMTVDQIWDLL